MPAANRSSLILSDVAKSFFDRASGSAADTRPARERALDYLASIAPEGIKNPAAEFIATTETLDEQGNYHVRFQQMLGNVPVYGAELIAHSKNGVFQAINGRYYPSPALDQLQTAIDAVRAIEKVKEHLGAAQVKTDWSAQELGWIGGNPFRPELVVYHPDNETEQEVLAWHIVAYPNPLRRAVPESVFHGGAVAFRHVDESEDIAPTPSMELRLNVFLK